MPNTLLFRIGPADTRSAMTEQTHADLGKWIGDRLHYFADSPGEDVDPSLTIGFIQGQWNVSVTLSGYPVAGRGATLREALDDWRMALDSM